MTEEFDINRSTAKCIRMREMSEETSQTRVSRYKEERRKQLAGQFAHLLRGHHDVSSSSSALDQNIRKTPCRTTTSNGVKDEDVRKVKILNNYKNPNKIRYKNDAYDVADSKLRNGGSVTFDSQSPVTNLPTSNRDKSAKRKSFLNRSANNEKTPNNNHNHNYCYHLNHHSSAYEGHSILNGNTRMIIPFSLRVPVTVSGTSVASSLALSTDISSHKTSSSPSFRNKLTVFDESQFSSQITCNGFAQTFISPLLPVNSSSRHSSRSKDLDDVQPPLSSSLDQERHIESSERILSPLTLVEGTSDSSKNDTSFDNTYSNCREHNSDENPSESVIIQYPDLNVMLDRTAECLNVDSFRSRKNSVTTTTTSEDLFTHKNSLLEIINNFSDRNSDIYNIPCTRHNNVPTVAENDVEQPRSSLAIETVDLTTKQSPFIDSKCPNLKTENGLTQNYQNCPLTQNASLEIIEEDNISLKPSILKKKQDEHSIYVETSKPNSILKRKPIEEISNNLQSISISHRQGILKKYSSLDEEEIRRRSCSPDVDINRHQEFKPILKTKRRSSLEELVRNRSPELHSILKRSKAFGEEVSGGRSSPQGILKRKISVINGHYECRSLDIEMHSDTDSTVRPILKNKQYSLDLVDIEKIGNETPRPILKKKQWTKNEVEDEKPKKPILKSSRKSLNEDETSPVSESVNIHLKFADWNAIERRIKPILKKRDENHIDTRSVKSDDDMVNDNHENIRRVKRNSLPGSGIVMHRFYSPSPSDMLDQSRVVPGEVDSVKSTEVDERKTTYKEELMNNARDSLSTRMLRISRKCERYMTQPITRGELTSTKSVLEEKHFNIELNVAVQTMESDIHNTEISKPSKTDDDNDEKRKTRYEESEKEVIKQLRRSNSVSVKASLFAQLANESKKASEDYKSKKRNENICRRKLKVKCSDLGSRFATQPVTLEEVAEAKKQNLETRSVVTENRKSTNKKFANSVETTDILDHSFHLPISERVKLFTSKIEMQKCSAKPVKRLTGSRFNTQPVTTEEVQVAKKEIFRSSTNTVKTVNDLTSRPESTDEKCNSKSSFNAEKKMSPANIFAEKMCEENSSETGSQSEGDTSSSGGREIQSIISGNRYETNRNQNNCSGIGKMDFGSIIAGATDVVDECPVINGTSSIAQRLAALKKSGQLDWKKRISRIAPEKEVSPVIKVNETQEQLRKELSNGFRCKIASEVHANEKNDGTLADRLEKLETSSKTWKTRIEPSDAVQFSVAGKIASTLTASPKLLPVASPLSERKKRGPCPLRFRSFREQKRDLHSEPASPEKSTSAVALNRSNSLPSEAADEGDDKTSREGSTVVSVPQIHDDNFSMFFGSMKSSLANETNSEMNSDFTGMKVETVRLLPVHKKVRIQRKHVTSGNPLKTLATRIEIKNEYREVKTNVAEREIKRVNVEKLSKNSSLAVEVLASLASKEDFSAVQLKKATPLTSSMLPYKSLMLLHIKGRRHVQTRLVEPVISSVNSGDSYVLVTSNEVYHWIGQYANVIERSRGAEVAQHIVSTHDLGCSSALHVITIVEDSLKSNLKSAQQFWMLLGATPEQADSIKAIGTGHPDEDEVYESSLISTNIVYEVTEDELIPSEKHWATIPKIQMLDPNKVFVFDFGTEMYVWMGKNVDMKLRKSSVRLAKELWENGFNYEECDLCPITSASLIGNRDSVVNPKKRSNERPTWCLFAKVTQHMETVLFREKFLDWPDFSRVIRAKGKDEDTEKQTDSSFDVSPCDAKKMLEERMTEPDLILEGCHLGRGSKYFDEELKRYYLVSTLDVQMWHVAEFDSEEVSRESLGQFYSTDSYVIKWVYSISYTGRELSGQPSKHTTMGRDRCVYFYWQGKNASLNEQGTAALVTVELDKEKGVQIRICQGYEPPAFFNLFRGRAVIYKSKRSHLDKEWRLFVCRGEIDSEAVLLEVSCNIRQLRSRASFVLINVSSGVVYLWHGCKVTKTAEKVCQSIANNLAEKLPPELELNPDTTLTITEINEGFEPKEFFKGLGSSSRKLYMSLIQDKNMYDTTPFLFSLTSNNGTLCAVPIWSPCRHKDVVTAYPFLQEELYSASQPALFLMDTGKELWLWQGWWPERKDLLETEQAVASEEATQNLEKDRGSASIRWQTERRAAMSTTLNYWKLKYPGKPLKSYLVWAGLEPIEFTNLFPDWDDRDDIAEINIMDGRKSGEVLDVEQELERLTQSTYPIEQLLQRPLPDGVDPTKLELYLSTSHFKEILNVTKEEFAALPAWKQTNLKKNSGLF